MKGLREKFRNKKGFTLIEMLIVVAIVAILIAISIPLVNGALEKARRATDAANERAAKAEIMVCYLADVTYDGTNKVVIDKTYAYDATDGKLTQATVANKYGKCSDHKDQVILLSINKDGVVSMTWAADYTAGNAVTGGDLCGSKVNSAI